jgi:hypothetical protein
MKKTRGDKPRRKYYKESKMKKNTSYDTYIHGNITRKLPVKLPLSQAKMSCFCFLFSLFSLTKPENRRAEQVLPSGEGWHQWEEGGVGKRGRRVNIVQYNMYTCQ